MAGKGGRKPGSAVRGTLEDPVEGKAPDPPGRSSTDGGDAEEGLREPPEGGGARQIRGRSRAVRQGLPAALGLAGLLGLYFATGVEPPSARLADHASHAPAPAAETPVVAQPRDGTPALPAVAPRDGVVGAVTQAQAEPQTKVQPEVQPEAQPEAQPRARALQAPSPLPPPPVDVAPTPEPAAGPSPRPVSVPAAKPPGPSGHLDCDAAYRLLLTSCAHRGLCIKDLDRWAQDDVRAYRRLHALDPTRMAGFDSLCWRACHDGAVSPGLFAERVCPPSRAAVPGLAAAAPHPSRKPARAVTPKVDGVAATAATATPGATVVLTVGQSTLDSTLRALGPAAADHRWSDRTRELTYRFGRRRVLLAQGVAVDGVTLWFDPQGLLAAARPPDVRAVVPGEAATVAILPGFAAPP